MFHKFGLRLVLLAVIALSFASVGASSAQGSTVTLNGTAKVITADIVASNGVIHVIDTVLIPPAAGASATMSATMAATMSATMDSSSMAATMSAAPTMAATMSATTSAMGAATMASSSQTIADIVSSNADFSTLLAALQAANLTDVFAKPGTYTVFAPNNAAFAAFLKAQNMTAAQLLADKTTLTAVLTYHVVPQVLKAADLLSMTSVPTLNGATISITVK